MLRKVQMQTVFMLVLVCCVSQRVAVAQDAGGPPDRSQIETKYKWNLADMYASDEAWNEDYQKLEQMIQQFAALKGTVGQSPDQLYKVLHMHDELNVHLDKLIAYAALKFDQDMLISKQQAMRDRAMTLAVKYQEATIVARAGVDRAAA